jgi:hypothetical protein
VRCPELIVALLHLACHATALRRQTAFDAEYDTDVEKINFANRTGILQEGSLQYYTNTCVYSGGDALKAHVAASLAFLYPDKSRTIKAALESGGSPAGLSQFALWAIAGCLQCSGSAKDDEQVADAVRLRYELLRATKVQEDVDNQQPFRRWYYNDKGEVRYVGTRPTFTVLPLVSANAPFFPLSNSTAASFVKSLGGRNVPTADGLNVLFKRDSPALTKLLYVVRDAQVSMFKPWFLLIQAIDWSRRIAH